MPALKKIHFQAAAAKIENHARLDPVAERPLHGRANQPRFLLAADHFEFDAGFALDALHQAPVVARFARRGRGHGAVGGHLMSVHAVAEMAEGARGARNRVVVQQMARESVVAQPHRGALGFQDLDVLSERWRARSPAGWRSIRRQWLPVVRGRPLVSARGAQVRAKACSACRGCRGATRCACAAPGSLPETLPFAVQFDEAVPLRKILEFALDHATGSG